MEKEMEEKEFSRYKVSEILKNKKKFPNFIYVNPNVYLSLTIKIMQDYGISHLPVMDGGEILGVIDEQLLIRLLGKNIDFEKSKVKEFMNTPLPVVTHDTFVDDVYEILKLTTKAIIVKEGKKITGIITPIDILNFYINPKDEVEFVMYGDNYANF
jgi:cystathionine beta-synthase